MNEQQARTSLKEFFGDRKVALLYVFLGIIVGVYFDWNMIEILIFLIFLWSLLGPIPSRYLAGAAAFFLACTPILHLLKRPERAEEFSVYAYYFLVMAVIRAIVEIRTPKDEVTVLKDG